MDDDEADAVAAEITRVLDEGCPGIVTAWSLVLERVEPDGEPAVTFLAPPDQRLSTAIGHARMFTLETEAEFREWYDADRDDDP